MAMLGARISIPDTTTVKQLNHLMMQLQAAAKESGVALSVDPLMPMVAPMPPAAPMKRGKKAKKGGRAGNGKSTKRSVEALHELVVDVAPVQVEGYETFESEGAFVFDIHEKKDEGPRLVLRKRGGGVKGQGVLAGFVARVRRTGKQLFVETDEGKYVGEICGPQPPRVRFLRDDVWYDIVASAA